MSEYFPEPIKVTPGELADMVQLSALDTVPTLANPDKLYADAWAAYQSAECKGNPEEIIEAQERLRGIRETYPGLE